MIRERRLNMDRNTENQAFEIKIPEPPEKPSEKKKSKLPLIISLCTVGVLIIASAIIAGILFIPLMTTPHWENTLNEVFFDAEELRNFSESISEGAEANIDLGLKKELTGLLEDINFKLSVSSMLSEDSESGALTLTLGEEDAAIALSLVYDKESMAIGIYDIINGNEQKNNSYISVPRKNITEEFKKSVFAPDSGSEFALDQEIFEEIVKALETFEDLDKEQDTESIEASLNRISEQIVQLIKPETSLEFSDSEFALVKDISFRLTKDDIIAIIDIFITEAESNEQLLSLFDPTYAATSAEGTGISLLEALKEAKDELPDGEILFAYSVSGDYVRNVRYSFTASDDSEESFDALLNFIYEETSGFDLKITYSDSGEDSIVYRKHDTETELKTECTLTADGEELKVSALHNKTDGELIISASSSDDPESVFELRGTLKYDKDASYLSLSFDSLKVGTADPIESFSFGFDIGRNTDNSPIPEAIQLFEVTAEDLADFIENLPKETFSEMLESYTGKNLESYLSADGQLMLNPEQYTEIAIAYAEAYRMYLATTEIMPANAVYVPVPELGINILLHYDKLHQMIYYNFAYNMTEDLLSIYHIASFDKNGNMIAHKVVVEKDQPATCTESGSIIYSCTICGKKHSEGNYAFGHNFQDYTDTVINHLGKECQAYIRACTYCGNISNIFVDGYYSLTFEKNKDEGYTLTQYDISFSNTGDYFFIPKPQNTEIKITALKDPDKYGFAAACIVIPDGVTSIQTGAFKYAHSMQVLVLPQTLTEIKDNAFIGETNLRTIYYCGTEEQWKQLALGAYAAGWSDVKVIFCPNGINPWEITDKLRFENELYEAEQNQKKLTESISSAKAAAKHDKVSLIDSGTVRFTAYDEKTGLIAVCGAYKNSKTEIRVYDAKTMKLSFSFEIDDDIHALDIGEGYIALASNADSVFYVRSITDGTTERVEFGDRYSSNRNKTTQIFIDCGYVYACDEDQHCNIVAYSINDKNLTVVASCYEPYLIFYPEKHRIVSLETNLSMSWCNLIDTEKGKLMATFEYQRTYLYSNSEMPVFTNVIDTPSGKTYDFDGNETNEKPLAPQYAEVTLSNDYFISEKLFSTEEVSALFVAKDGYDILMALGGTNSAEPIIIDWYAEKALYIGDGKVLLYTPEGYGLLLVNMN